MTAKEMFEELGYTKYKEFENGKAFMYYEPSENYGIVFDLVHRDIDFGDGCMTIKDFKAIHQQLLENEVEEKYFLSDLKNFLDFRKQDDLTMSFFNRYKQVKNANATIEEFIDYIEMLPTSSKGVGVKKMKLYNFNEADTLTMPYGYTGTLTCRNVQNYNKKFYYNKRIYKPSPLMCLRLMGFEV